jgi:hypothetical protein
MKTQHSIRTGKPVVKPALLADNQGRVTMRKLRLLAAIATALAMVVASAGDKGFNPPPATHAKTYPIHEAHNDEGVVVAIDLYDTPDKAAIFKVKYKDYDFLPVRLIISNDSGKPLMLDDLKVEYVTSRRDKLPPADKQDIFRRIAHPEKITNKSPVRLPIPGPHKQPTAISKDAAEEVDSALFVPVPVTPQSTNSGFLFFDVRDIESPEAGAHIYLAGIRAGTKELFYLDIPLEKPAAEAPDHE